MVFNERNTRLHGGTLRSLELPCGQCIGCRMTRSQHWAIRCVHEASLHPHNCFVTLTYDTEHLLSPSLNYRDFQLFMKKLRARFERVRIRFFCAGEYGGLLGRPHFHALLFGISFHEDRVYFSKSPSGEKLYRSPTLEALWTHGYSSIGNVTKESAGYVARYCVKKITGKNAEAHYKAVDADGVIYDLEPEFARMSTAPGIGTGWVKKWHGDISRDGYVVVDGKEVPMPRFYRRLLDEIDYQKGEAIDYEKHKATVDNFADRSNERLRVRKEVAQAALRVKKRTLT